MPVNLISSTLKFIFGDIEVFKDGLEIFTSAPSVFEETSSTYLITRGFEIAQGKTFKYKTKGNAPKISAKVNTIDKNFTTDFTLFVDIVVIIFFTY